jgi:hypothetical protein
MGFESTRSTRTLFDLYWADMLGLLVWDEMPSACRFTARSIHRLMREWTEAMERDISHPCVVMGFPSRESWGVPELRTPKIPLEAIAAAVRGPR